MSTMVTQISEHPTPYLRPARVRREAAKDVARLDEWYVG